MASIKNYQATWDALIKEKAKDELVPFWYAEKEIFHSKTKGLMFAEKNNLQLKLNLFDKLYIEYDWTKPWNVDVIPTKLQRLRDKNQYLRLWYSSGIDSHLILEASIKNHIPIDEIIMGVALPGSYADHEIETRGHVPLSKYKEKFPKTKITWCNLEKKDWRTFYDKDIFVEQSGVNFFNDRPLTRSFMYNHTKYSDHLWEPYINKKSICDIFGDSIPKILKIDNEWYWYTTDTEIGHNYSPFMDRFYQSCIMPEVQNYFAHQFKNNIQETYKDSKYAVPPNSNVLKLPVMLNIVAFKNLFDYNFKGAVKNIINHIDMKDESVKNSSWQLLTDLISEHKEYLRVALDAKNKKEPIIEMPGIYSKLFGLDTRTIKFLTPNLFPNTNFHYNSRNMLNKKYKNEYEQYTNRFIEILNDYVTKTK